MDNLSATERFEDEQHEDEANASGDHRPFAGAHASRHRSSSRSPLRALTAGRQRRPLHNVIRPQESATEQHQSPLPSAGGDGASRRANTNPIPEVRSDIGTLFGELAPELSRALARQSRTLALRIDQLQRTNQRRSKNAELKDVLDAGTTPAGMKVYNPLVRNLFAGRHLHFRVH